MNNCIHCEELSGDTLSICIKCAELLLGAIEDVSRLQSLITELEPQLEDKTAKIDNSAPIPPYRAQIKEILTECENATQRMVNIGKQVQGYKESNTTSEEK